MRTLKAKRLNIITILKKRGFRDMPILAKTALGNTPDAVINRGANQGAVTVKYDRIERITSGSLKSSVGRCRSISLRVSIKNRKGKKGRKESTGLYHSCNIKVLNPSSRSEDGSYDKKRFWLLNENSSIWVHCRCAYFLYYCEQALARIKASDIYDCRVDMRSLDINTQRNPSLTPYLCKHLVAALLVTIDIEKHKKKYNEIMPKDKDQNDYDEKAPPSYRG